MNFAFTFAATVDFGGFMFGFRYHPPASSASCPGLVPDGGLARARGGEPGLGPRARSRAGHRAVQLVVSLESRLPAQSQQEVPL